MDESAHKYSWFRKECTIFFSNVVLGFNDALIELTGALVGFSFALHEAKLIAVAGLVTGVSASLSMAASAYQQARHEKGRNPFKAAAFTGVSYFVIALLLVLPFILLGSIAASLVAMGVLALLLIAGVSYLSAHLLGRGYFAQFAEMCVFSLGVAAVTFLIGRLLGTLVGVQ